MSDGISSKQVENPDGGAILAQRSSAMRPQKVNHSAKYTQQPNKPRNKGLFQRLFNVFSPSEDEDNDDDAAYQVNEAIPMKENPLITVLPPQRQATLQQPMPMPIQQPVMPIQQSATLPQAMQLQRQATLQQAIPYEPTPPPVISHPVHQHIFQFTKNPSGLETMESLGNKLQEIETSFTNDLEHQMIVDTLLTTNTITQAIDILYSKNPLPLCSVDNVMELMNSLKYVSPEVNHTEMEMLEEMNTPYPDYNANQMDIENDNRTQFNEMMQLEEFHPMEIENNMLTDDAPNQIESAQMETESTPLQVAYDYFTNTATPLRSNTITATTTSDSLTDEEKQIFKGYFQNINDSLLNDISDSELDSLENTYNQILDDIENEYNKTNASLFDLDNGSQSMEIAGGTMNIVGGKTNVLGGKTNVFGGKSMNGEMTGGKCGEDTLINAAAEHTLYWQKLKFEHVHDFIPERTKGLNNSLAYYSDNGVYNSINNGWDIASKFPIAPGYEDEIEGAFLQKIGEATKIDEPTYIKNTLDVLIDKCYEKVENSLYTPLLIYKAKDLATAQLAITEFKKYFDGLRIIVRQKGIAPNIYYYFYISGDTLPTDQYNNIDDGLGICMSDMNLDDYILTIGGMKKTLYGQCDTGDIEFQYLNTLIANPSTTDNVVKEFIQKSPELKTPARMLDPINTSMYDIADGILVQDEQIYEILNAPIDQGKSKEGILSDCIRLASINGINRLLNVWVNVEPGSQIVTDMVLNVLPTDPTKTSSITFTTLDGKLLTFEIGQTTVSQISKSLEYISTILDDSDKYETIIQKLTNAPGFPIICKATAFVLLYNANFRPNFKENLNITPPMTHKTITMMIVAYWKSCGDEFQRLTCEELNKILPEKFTNTSNNINIFTLTDDRILVGECLLKDTPVVSTIKSFHTQFNTDIYEKVSTAQSNRTAFYLEGITRGGILTNRKNVFQTEEPVDKKIARINRDINNIIVRINTKLPEESPIVNEANDTELTVVEEKHKLYSKMLIALQYYNSKDDMSKSIYAKVIDKELKNLVWNILSSEQKSLFNKTSRSIPTSVHGLQPAIMDFIGDMEIPSKLMGAYQRAVITVQLEIENYVKIVNTPEIAALISPTVVQTITTHYNSLVQNIGNETDDFLDKIIKKVKTEELKFQSTRTSRGVVLKHVNTDIVMQLDEKERQLREMEEQLKIEIAEIEKTAVSPPEETKKKSLFGKVSSFLDKQRKKIESRLKKVNDTAKVKMDNLRKSINDLSAKMSTTLPKSSADSCKILLSSLITIKTQKTLTTGGIRALKSRLLRKKTRRNNLRIRIPKRGKITKKRKPQVTKANSPCLKPKHTRRKKPVYNKRTKRHRVHKK